MSDCRAIAANIRAYLAAGEVRWSDEMQELASSYATLCREANERLRRCEQYLHRGMRSEAIHLAECQPQMPEMVSALNFPQRKAWVEACAAHGLSTPPALLTECLETLGTATTREERLRPLLSRHRMLALAKAPARERLEILRLLAEQDGENPCWTDETRALEAIRAQQIRAEAGAASLAADGPALEQLWAEVTKRPWRAAVPEDLRQSLGEAVESLRHQRAEAELRAMVPDLLAAFEAEPRNGELTPLLERWDELAGAAGGVVPDDLLLQLQPLLDWRVEEARRRAERDEVKPFQREADVEAAPRNRHRPLILATVIGFGVLLLIVVAVSYGHYINFARLWK